MFDNLPPVTQGSLGLSYAIAYLTKKGYNVSVPLVDNQSYDLVCEVENELKKVQVKTTRFKQNSNYSVQLKSVRVNRTENNIHNFDNKASDYLLVVTEIGDIYFIPTSKIEAKSALSLGSKYESYRDRL
jgi:hypothetical protein